MGREFKVAGILFTDEGIMRYNGSNKTRVEDNKQPLSNNGSLHVSDSNMWLRHIQTAIHSLPKAKQMAIKGAVLLFNTLGWLSLGLNFIFAIIGTIDEVKQWVLLVFSCVFAGMKIYQLYQNAAYKREEVRSRRLENDEKEFKQKISHQKQTTKTA